MFSGENAGGGIDKTMYSLPCYFESRVMMRGERKFDTRIPFASDRVNALPIFSAFNY